MTYVKKTTRPLVSLISLVAICAPMGVIGCSDGASPEGSGGAGGGGHEHAGGADAGHEHDHSAEEGSLTVIHDFADDAFQAGEVSFTISLADSEQMPVSGAEVLVQAIMDAHGHSAEGTVTVIDQKDGSYLVEGLVFQMPGTWTIHIKASSDEGSAHTHASVEVK